MVRAGLGTSRRLAAVERLRGGSKKGVYRLTLDDESTVIGYVWAAAENYWPRRGSAVAGDVADPFSDASGLDLFEASHACLSAIGVRVPQLIFLDRSRACYPDDIALVEDVRGQTLERQLQHDLPGAQRSMVLLDAALQAMAQHRGQRIGKLAWVRSAAAGGPASCEKIVLDRALGDLDEAACRVARVAGAREQLAAVTRELAAAVRPRASYCIIHGELGPDHVLIDHHGQPVIIDIEGVMFFDIEWEHVFLRLRFGEHYRLLRSDGLDDRRLRFYQLAMHLSLIAGPLRLLDGDFPDRDEMRQIAAYNTASALAFVR